MSYFPPYIDASGIHMPTYADRLEDLCSAYRSVFGQEAELTPAVPDYQLLSVFARALDDVSAFVVQAYNSRNPAYASGQALDLLLPQYGITRNPGETDAEVRTRMNQALAGNGNFSLEAMEAEIRTVPYVEEVKIRANDGDAAVDGIPAHTIAALVQSGNANRIAEAIFRKKPPGIGTSGSLTRQVSDGRGNTVSISFSRPSLVLLQFRVVVKAYDGFDQAAVKEKMAEALFGHVNKEIHIGEAMNIPGLYGMLYQAAESLASTFAITDLVVNTYAYGTCREKIIPAWNERFWMDSTADVLLETVE